MKSGFSIHPDTRLGPVHLTVADLSRSLRFYGDVMGLLTLSNEGGTAQLGDGDGTALLVLTGDPQAPPPPERSTGLYHFALLLPSRGGLASFLRHLAERRYPIQGASDHRVSEAVYLADPEGNGIEVYVDRPRGEWGHRNGMLEMTTDPLDFESLMDEPVEPDHPWDGLPQGSRVGHVHLRVSDLLDAELFYHRLLGFDIMQRYGPSALFLSAGGYHHHIGLNTWRSAGAPPPPAGAAGLRRFTIQLPDAQELGRLAERVERARLPAEEREGGLFLRDPSGNGVLLTT